MDAERGYAVAKVLYNFGRADKLEDKKLKRLAESILRVIGDREARGQNDEIKLHDAWPFGGIWVLEQLWNQLGLGKILEQQRKNHKKETVARYERALFAMIANRALEPDSKRHCWERWSREKVFLPSAAELALHDYYLAMDYLEEHKAEIEKAVYFAVADLMEADVDLIFYDTTSLHFEVDEEDQDGQEATFPDMGTAKGYPAQRERGYSKNGHTDAPQIVIGLAVTRHGLPVRSWVFPGSTGDVTTVARVKEDLRGWRLGRCVFVGDAGMNSADNRRELALGGGKYILAAKMRAGDDVTHDVLARPGRFKEVADNRRIKEIIVGDGERRQRYVVCHNPVEERRQRKHREQLISQLEAELETMRQQPGAHSKRQSELLASKRYRELIAISSRLRRGRGGLSGRIRTTWLSSPARSSTSSSRPKSRS